MCIVFFVFGHSKYKLILATNRDEYLNRPTQRAHFWDAFPNVLGGIDMGIPKIQEEHMKTPSQLNNHRGLKRQQENGHLNYGEDNNDDDDEEDDDEFVSKNSKMPSIIQKNCSISISLHGHDDIIAETWIGNGTWLGMTLHGKFSVITNYREHPSTWLSDARSRGYLVRDFLYHQGTCPKLYAEKVSSETHLYNGFNLVVGQVDGPVYLVTNRSKRSANKKMKYNNVYENNVEVSSKNEIDGVDQEIDADNHDGFIHQAVIHELNRGQVYGVSNGYFEDHHRWPKVHRGKKIFEEIIKEWVNEDKEQLIEELLKLLKNTEDVPDDLLPPNMYDYTLEKKLSPICIDKERCHPMNYATKTHTIIVVDQQNHVTFLEVDRYMENDDQYVLKEDHKRFDFVLE